MELGGGRGGPGWHWGAGLGGGVRGAGWAERAAGSRAGRGRCGVRLRSRAGQRWVDTGWTQTRHHAGLGWAQPGHGSDTGVTPGCPERAAEPGPQPRSPAPLADRPGHRCPPRPGTRQGHVRSGQLVGARGRQPERRVAVGAARPGGHRAQPGGPRQPHQPVRPAALARGAVVRGLCRRGGRGRAGQHGGHLDHPGAPADAHAHQLVPGQPGLLGRVDGRLQHAGQLHLRAARRVVLRSRLLPLPERLPHHRRLRQHLLHDCHRGGQVRGHHRPPEASAVGHHHQDRHREHLGAGLPAGPAAVRLLQDQGHAQPHAVLRAVARGPHAALHVPHGGHRPGVPVPPSGHGGDLQHRGRHAVGRRDPGRHLQQVPGAAEGQEEGGEDDDRGGGDLCHLLAALPRLLHPHGGLPAAQPLEVHPAGLPGQLLAGHELHHVQPHHLLLPQQEVPHRLQAGLPLVPVRAGVQLRGAGAEEHGSVPRHTAQQSLHRHQAGLGRGQPSQEGRPQGPGRRQLLPQKLQVHLHRLQLPQFPLHLLGGVLLSPGPCRLGQRGCWPADLARELPPAPEKRPHTPPGARSPLPRERARGPQPVVASPRPPAEGGPKATCECFFPFSLTDLRDSEGFTGQS